MKNFRDLQAARVAQPAATETVFDTLNVMLVKCASCPWRKDGGVLHDDPESRLALQVSVATHNTNRSGPQSSQFWDHIKCNYPVV
jgi:hypothetical protein